jgi:hypothetical protein
MAKSIKHLLSADEKISHFNTDEEFIQFVKKIILENGDEGKFGETENIEELEFYILYFCDNLELI